MEYMDYKYNPIDFAQDRISKKFPMQTVAKIDRVYNYARNLNGYMVKINTEDGRTFDRYELQSVQAMFAWNKWNDLNTKYEKANDEFFNAFETDIHETENNLPKSHSSYE